MTFTAVLLGAIIDLPVGAMLAMACFPVRAAVTILLNALMA